MKSTVLYHMKGVITEERFQKMTLPQWYFHYKLIKDNESKDQDFMIKLTEVILDKLEMVASFSNPELGQKLQEMKDIKKAENELPAEQFASVFDQIKQMLPEKVTVTYDEPERGGLPKVDRKKFLGIKRVGDD